MFKSYLKIAWRNLKKNKLFSLINILGLAVGLAIVIMIGLFVVNEMSVDKHNEYYSDIYRIEGDRWFNIPAPMKPLIDDMMPGLVASARTEFNNLSVKVSEQDFTLYSLCTDADFLDIFTTKFISGDGKAALKNTNTLLLSESEAKRIFGRINVIGETILVNEKHNFTISGVFEDIPENSHFHYSSIISMQTRADIYNTTDLFDNWNNWNYLVYLRLQPNVNIADLTATFNDNFNEFLKEDSGEGTSRLDFQMKSIRDVYFHVYDKSDGCKHGNLSYVYMFLSAAILTLVIAIINFINLSTARAGLRSVEIGVRKVTGATKSNLLAQFMGETLLTVIISFFLGIGIIELSLPLFNKLTNSNLEFNILHSPLVILGMILGVAVITILAGYYPALHLSKLNPTKALKKESYKGRKGLAFRRLLILIQFFITITLIFGTITIAAQMQFVIQKDLGFDEDQILITYLNGDLADHKKEIKEILLKETDIEEVSYCHSVPGNMKMQWGRNTAKGENINFFSVPCDEDYMNVLGLEIVEGRAFNPNLESDRGTFIFNEAAVKAFGWDNPLEEELAYDESFGGSGTIVGVVKDFSFQSLHHTVKPMAFTFEPGWGWVLAVKGRTDNYDNLRQRIELLLNDFTDKPIHINFLDQIMEKKYRDDKRFEKIFKLFSFLAIMISCLGLLGLISYEVNRRTKEIGVRKVMGASVVNILYIFGKELFILLCVSSVIAWTTGYFIMKNWLLNFAYHTSISWWVFILSFLITLFITFVTFSLTAGKAANSNPVTALKYE